MTRRNPLYHITPELRSIARKSWDAFKEQPESSLEYMSRAEAFRIGVLDMALDYYERTLLAGEVPNMTVLRYILAAPALRGHAPTEWDGIADQDTIKLSVEMNLHARGKPCAVAPSANAQQVMAYWGILKDVLETDYPLHYERFMTASACLETMRPPRFTVS